MEFVIKVKTIRELAEVSGVMMAEIADHLDLSLTMTHLKLKGARATFLDECPKLAAALNSGGRLNVTAQDVIEIMGRSNLKVRGFAG